MSINVNLAKLPYDPQKDLAPLSGMMRSTLFIVASPMGGLKSLQDLVAFGKANPGALNYGTPGIGTAQHLAGELLKIMAGIEMVHVPFKGSNEGATAVMGGQIQLAIVGPAGIAPQVRAGKLQVIAGTDTQRSPGLPDVPTVAESGLPGYAASGWLGLFAPAGTPSDIVARLNAEIVRALRLPEVSGQIVSGGEQPHPTTPEELGRFVRSETEKWARVIKTAGIRLDR
jgi:tripartite-type tricarboxylate transporter receptor subunit TctC